MVKEIIVIGAGLAGLTCSVKSANKNMHVKLFSPAHSERSQSVMAMGGINAALNTKGEDDSVNEHYTDTINAGQHINNHNAVEKLTNDAPEIIDWLSKLGTSFTRDDDGNVDVRYFGGQKKMRTAYAGARTGKQILTAINTECRKWEYKEKIKRYVGWRFLSLILDDNKVCRGVVMINENTAEIRDFYADFVVIASGGMNKVFGKISGSLHNDGFVSGKLLHQGIELANMEMIQYHPTTIETPVKRMLITEAARGEGGRLYTLRNGEKWYFMEEWYPEQGALMPRDVVSRSIYRVCHEDNMGIDGENKVYLDLTHLDEKTVKTKLDEVYDVCMNYLNLDPTREPIPVYPGVHYFMGGIRTDDAHKTNIRNLFAIGECSSQYHGANRLGGNSLLGAIHGGWVVADQLEEISCENNSSEEYEILNYEYEAYENWKELQKEANNISSYEIEEEIANIMNRTMGIYRTESELKEGLNKLDSLETIHVNSHGCYYDYILLRSLIDIAKAMLSSALARKESRGAHQRLDYPETNEEYLKTTVISFDNDELKITFNDTEERMSW